ncbi:MAG: tyrosine-type recombinase/integrase [Gammaproteobacteria bacterium]
MSKYRYVSHRKIFIHIEKYYICRLYTEKHSFYPIFLDTTYLFVIERKGPLSTSTVRKLVARAVEKAKIGFPVHPHILRHACGFKLANDGQDTRAVQHYLGHKNIQHTV